jgi:hypothetical protein
VREPDLPANQVGFVTDCRLVGLQEAGLMAALRHPNIVGFLVSG